ncbi:unnamed protein product [Echinostoma caproni]|uniref:DUF5742 domain-containing protein n=1 Tax=Echinostoma caproni TaxID=27848 RepID=A0A183ATF0_9TREM|nr:unnamed protein product [Echinostoma caproni]
MSKKVNGKNVKEVDDILRILCSVSSPDIPLLRKLSVLLKKHPQAFSNQTGKIESSLLSLVGVRKSSCDLQKSIHTHYSHHDSSQNKALPLAAECFSLLPSLTNPPYRTDRFLDFQLKVLYALSESYATVLQLLKFSHISLSSLRDHLSSKCKPFISLGLLKQDEMPSPEYLQLVLARIDFFTAVLRYIFEPKIAIECALFLPMITALFTAILSVELTSHGKTTSALLLRSSSLLHCLASICQSVGLKMIPATVSLLTLMVYQLEWTAAWREQSKVTGGLTKHRLATYRCLRTLVSGMIELSSSRLVALLPRILDQLVQDLVYCCGDESGFMSSESDSFEFRAASCGPDSKQATAYGSVNCHMLLAVLDVITHVFESSERFNSPGESLLLGLSRLQLCLIHIMRHLTSSFLSGPHYKQMDSAHNVITHPSVLTALLKASRHLCSVSSSPHLHTVFETFANTLKTHYDPQVRVTAYEQGMLLNTSKCSTQLVSISEAPKPVTEPLIVKEVIMPLYDSNNIPMEMPKECNTEKEMCSSEKSPKRRRMEFTEATSDTVQEVAVTTSAIQSTIDACLSSFDPTFV